MVQELATPYRMYARVGINGFKEWRVMATSGDLIIQDITEQDIDDIVFGE